MINYHILIIEDEKNLSFFVAEALRSEGYSVCEADSIAVGKSLMQEHYPDLLLLDVQLPDGSGLDLLKELKVKEKQINVILMTAYGSIDQAVEAIKLGAVNYVPKPFDLNELLIKVSQVFETELIKREINYYIEKEEKIYNEEYLVCRSEKMQALYELVKKVASSSNASVLIEGESGTGKEMIARMVHKYSPRSNKGIIDINCASIPENLIESELFGYEQGAFTSANKRKIGLLELANESTIILDEISEMPLSLQAKLLRVLETKTLRRLGGVNDIKVDFRLIAITNRNLKEMIGEKFREDLYYRLCVIPIEIIPLREHKDDIIDLADFFIRKFFRAQNKPIPKLDRKAQELLLSYNWPGNIRELKNVIERAVILCSDDVITSEDIFLDVNSPKKPTEFVSIYEEGIDLNNLLDELKEKYISEALKKCNNNQVKAAELLKIPRHIIRYYLEKKEKASG